MKLETLCPRCAQHVLALHGSAAQCAHCGYTERATGHAALVVALAHQHGKASICTDSHAAAFRHWFARATQLNASVDRVMCPWCDEPTLVIDGSIAYCERADCMFRLRMSDRAILFGELAGLHEARADYEQSHHARGAHTREAHYLRLVAEQERRATLQKEKTNE